MRVSTAALIKSGERLLFFKRPPGGALSDCWELPGGKVDEGESYREALRRELSEELGLDVTIGELCGETSFVHDGQRFRLLGFLVELDERPIELLEHVAFEYLTPRAAAKRRLAPSDRSLLEAIGEL